MEPEDPVDELTSVRELSAAFTSLRSSLDLLPRKLETLLRSQESGRLLFDDNGKLIGKETRDRCELPVDPSSEFSPQLLFECSAVECIEECVINLYDAQRKADVALHSISPRLLDILSGLVARPWDVAVRRECLDWVIAWPGETLHPTALASQTIPGKARDIIALASKRPPFETWTEYGEKLKSYGADLVALRGRLKPSVPGQKFVSPQEIAPLATDDQIIPSEFRTIPIEKKYAATLLGYKAPKGNANPQQWVNRRKMKVIPSGGLFVFDYREFPSAAWEKIVTPQTWAAIRPAPADNKS
ncbi:MAG: hypothetical protein JNL18_17045 [Planctomycetaceae bacterium]|nr:hypothetical protein [Planctomycetaceae bacterium]